MSNMPFYSFSATEKRMRYIRLKQREILVVFDIRGGPDGNYVHAVFDNLLWFCLGKKLRPCPDLVYILSPEKSREISYLFHTLTIKI